MQLVNIFNEGRTVYTFCREDNGFLNIKKDESFFPFYYEPDKNGKFLSYDEVPLRKVFVSDPKEIKKVRSSLSYASDVDYAKNYIIHKIPEFTKARTKFCFIDIEILCSEFPDVEKAELPISCITLYNNYTNQLRVWYLGDYKYETGGYNEVKMINDFIRYLSMEQFDMMLAWNMDFDWTYMFNRARVLLGKNLAKEISPIGKSKWAGKNLEYPAGCSIVDYMGLFRKVKGKEMAYKLDYILEKYLGEGKTYKEMDFSVLSPELKARNMEDVSRMVDLEESLKLIPYYDDIRMMCTCLWEDLPMKVMYSKGRLVTVSNNSKLIDMLLLREAYNQGLVLPSKPDNHESSGYEGAFREAYKKGRFTNVGKYDLTSAYPFAMIDFCLDPTNVGDPNGLELNGTKFKQNEKALIPTVLKKFMKLKFDIADEKSEASGALLDQLNTKYDAVKGIINSAYGVFGNPYFRLYDSSIASTTTFLVRDLLHYVVDKLSEKGYDVIYVDTDSVFIQDGINLTDMLNELIEEWGRVKYNKKISIKFDYEGVFEKLLIIALCRYKGYVRKPNGKLKEELTGIEVKRKDSSKFIIDFQTELLEKIMDGDDRIPVVNWINRQKEEIKKRPLWEISFPCKVSNTAESYKALPAFMRAYENGKAFGFNPKKGDPFYWLYIKSKGSDKEGKPIDVISLSKDTDYISNSMVNWDKMIDRNINTKCEKIFEAMNWQSPSMGTASLF